MLKLEYEPVKGQTFDIGRTINFTKCNCEKCDFLHCRNYAPIMKLKKFKNAKEFVEVWKQQNPEFASSVYTNHKAFEELVMDFIDRMTSFPKGLYWKLNHSWTNPEEVVGIDLVRMSKTRYEKEMEGDFVSLACINFNQNHDRTEYFAYHSCYSYCTDSAESVADRITRRLNEVLSELKTTQK